MVAIVISVWLSVERDKGFHTGTVEAVDLDSNHYWVTFDKPGWSTQIDRVMTGLLSLCVHLCMCVLTAFEILLTSFSMKFTCAFFFFRRNWKALCSRH